MLYKGNRGTRRRTRLLPRPRLHTMAGAFVLIALTSALMSLVLRRRHTTSAGVARQNRIALPGPSHRRHQRSNKTLVVLFGNIRGGEKAWQSLYLNVLDVNSADLALIVGYRPVWNGSSLYRRARYVWEIPEYDDWGDALDLIGGDGTWRKTMGAAENLFGGVHGSKQKGGCAIMMAMRWVLQSRLSALGLTAQYERFVITRTDQYYMCRQDLAQLDPAFVWIPRGEDYGGLCDRHLVLNSADVRSALSIIEPYILAPKSRADIRHLNCERAMKRHFQRTGLLPRVRRFKRTMFTCAVPGDATRHRKMTRSATKEGVHLKYQGEYFGARDTCREASHHRAPPSLVFGPDDNKPCQSALAVRAGSNWSCWSGDSETDNPWPRVKHHTLRRCAAACAASTPCAGFVYHPANGGMCFGRNRETMDACVKGDPGVLRHDRGYVGYDCGGRQATSALRDPNLVRHGQQASPQNISEGGAGRHHVVYNRVGKCGSTLLTVALQGLKTCKTVSLTQSFSPDGLSDALYATARRTFRADPAGCVILHGHFKYTRFSGDGSSVSHHHHHHKLKYITMIRDPVKRWRSIYNWYDDKCVKARQPASWCQRGATEGMLELFRKRRFASADDCIADALRSNASVIKHCTIAKDKTITAYFRGRGDEQRSCKDLVEQTMQRYAFIGVIEDCELSVRRLNAALRGTLALTSDICRRRMNARRDRKNKQRDAEEEPLQLAFASSSLSDRLRQELSCDYELYTHVRRRLHENRTNESEESEEEEQASDASSNSILVAGDYHKVLAPNARLGQIRYTYDFTQNVAVEKQSRELVRLIDARQNVASYVSREASADEGTTSVVEEEAAAPGYGQVKSLLDLGRRYFTGHAFRRDKGKDGGKLFRLVPRSPAKGGRRTLFDEPWSQFDGFKVDSELAAKQTSCQRVGGSADGGKLICGFDELRRTNLLKAAEKEEEGEKKKKKKKSGKEGDDSRCVIYSFGSNGDPSFELDMRNRTGCAIFTFDCTMSKKRIKKMRAHIAAAASSSDTSTAAPAITFRPWCVGRGASLETEETHASGLQPRFSIGEIMHMLSHRKLDILKIDVEGAEYDAIASLAADLAEISAPPRITAAGMPRIISMEVHAPGYDYEREKKASRRAGDEKRLAQLMDGRQLAGKVKTVLDALGYGITSREDNYLCASCTEIVFTRRRKRTLA